MTGATEVPALELRGLSKSFGMTRALDDVDLVLRRGEVHALCGHNGSGKSTLIKILSGYHQPDDGATLQIDGRNIRLPVGDGEQLGIRFVHQDLGMAPTQSVLENFWVGRHPTRGKLVDWRAARRLAAAQLGRFGLDVPLSTRVAQLTAEQRAILAVARAHRPEGGGSEFPEVLVLDEPTALLPAQEVERLVEALRIACRAGVAVLLVTHRLEEVLRYADRVTVLRDGRRVATEAVADVDHDRLVELMLGRRLGQLYPASHADPGREALLRVRGLTSGRATNVDLSLHAGEILGVTGLVGAGYEDVLAAIFGAQPSTGTIEVRGVERRFSSSADAIAAGIGLLPAGRLHSGVATATLVENFTLTTLERFRRGPLLDRRRERQATAAMLEGYAVVPPGSPNRSLSALSGGNQQKVLLAKWLEADLPVLLVHEPTQGVDIGAKSQLLRLLADAAQRGRGVLIASADYADLAGLCHRVLVFTEGRISAEVPEPDLAEETLAELCLRGIAA